MSLRDEIIDNRCAEDMLNSISPIYDNDYYNLVLINAIGKVVCQIDEYITNLDIDIYPQNAPKWLLELWANLYHVRTSGQPMRWMDVERYTWQEIAVYTWEEMKSVDVSDDDVRRSILNKIREDMPITRANYAEYIKSVTGYDVEIDDHPNEYTVTINLKGGRATGILPEELDAVIRATLPAHVDYLVQEIYMRWIEWDALNWTWQDLDNEAVTWNDLEQPEVWREWKTKQTT